MKHVEDMNISWNYQKCTENRIDFGGDNYQEAYDWLTKNGMPQEEQYAAMQAMEDYCKSYEEDGRGYCCVVWFD